MNAMNANAAVANLNAWFANDCRNAATDRYVANKRSIREEFNACLTRYGALNRMITKARMDENVILEDLYVKSRHETEMKIADLLDKVLK